MEQQLLQIQGTVENIVFRNKDNGYTVMDFDSNGEFITVVGEFGEITESESLSIYGNYINHPKFGMQFKAELYEQKLPDTSVNIEKYLASGAIKGIGSKLAMKIVSTFGKNSLEIIEKEPQRLLEIKGISPKKCKEITENAHEVFSLRIIKTFFDKYKIKYAFAMKAYLNWGSDALEIIRNNPYVLCDEIVGIDFEKADEIAFSLDFKENSSERIISGTYYVLKQNAMQGNSCMPVKLLFKQTNALLNIEKEDFISVCNKAISSKMLYTYKADNILYVYLPEYYTAEKYISTRICSYRPLKKRISCANLISYEEKKNNIKYETLQKKAINFAVAEKMIILTGGPGTGKTTTLNAIISILERKNLKVFLTAPTGRASKRLTELTGHEAKTIHRLLEMKYDEKKHCRIFNYNESNKLNCDAVIIDETSMVDVLLFEALLRAIKPSCKLIITGDSAQLPSVGAGNILHDLIEGQVLPVIELKTVFRQAQKSLIITNAHKIVSGEYPDLATKDNDFFFFLRSNPVLASQLVVALVKDRLPKTYGYSPIDDIQVIAPSRKGFLGTNELNRVLQNEINPPDSLKSEIKTLNGVFRLGDKVMQNSNNYQIEWEKNGESGSGIFNGDIGKIISISKEKVTIDFDGKIVEYVFEQLNQIELAYAITVHKSQGCEFKVVIIPIQDGFDMLNHRNLLYTAVTRAKKLLILIGNEQVIFRMVDNVRNTERFTCLKNMLSEKRKELENNVK